MAKREFIYEKKQGLHLVVDLSFLYSVRLVNQKLKGFNNEHCT